MVEAEPESPILTVITVVRNNAEGVKKTLLSVAKQSYSEIRHVVIDGGSSDGTPSVIKQHESAIDFWISEADHGIYDAMNKGIAQAHGQWLFFLNAGDEFYDDNVVNAVMAKALKIKEQRVVMYGKVLLGNKKEKPIVKRPKPLAWMYYGLFASHQSMFFRSETLANGYPVDYPLAGDYALVAQLYLEGARFIELNHIISVFEEGGLSYTHASQGRNENHQIRVNILGMPRTLSKLIYILNWLTWNLKSALIKARQRASKIKGV